MEGNRNEAELVTKGNIRPRIPMYIGMRNKDRNALAYSTFIHQHEDMEIKE